MLPYPVLLADIGGTYARFAVLTAPAIQAGPIWKVPTASFAGPVAAIQAYLAQEVIRPRSAFLAVAGRVGDGVMGLTNAHWEFDIGAIGVALALDAVRLVNDYVPLAAGLTNLDQDDPADLVRVGPEAVGSGTRLVIGPGTGLGAAALIPTGDRHLILTTEAGHVSFGRCEPNDGLPWSGLMPAKGRLTAETLLSGPGLLRLANALAVARGTAVSWRSPAEVLGSSKGDPLASEAVRHFARLLGRFAGDLALLFGATGGVFLAGGIAPRIMDELRGDAFHAAFEEKPPFREVMREIPRFVITRPEPAIDGLATLLRAQSRFLFPRQDWCGLETDQGRSPAAAAK